MVAPISLRSDFDGPMLRALVLGEKAGSVARGLLSLVTIYDGGSRADAALVVRSPSFSRPHLGRNSPS
jgi:hypothetical protein